MGGFLTRTVGKNIRSALDLVKELAAGSDEWSWMPRPQGEGQNRLLKVVL